MKHSQMGSDAYTPPGIPFMQVDGRSWMLVTKGHTKGWLCRQHPDGDWVTMRKADEADLGVVFQVAMQQRGDMSFGPINPEQRDAYLFGGDR